ncbi:MAG: GNAT family N-acetyltransferase [Candidatus Thorarchaeota archaeon]
MSIVMRDYHWNEDFETVREFLIEIWNAGPLYRNWIPSMFENLKFGPGGLEYQDKDDEYIKIWEISRNGKDQDSRIIAVSILKPSGMCWINIHPEFLDYEKHIILWAVEQIKNTKPDTDDSKSLRLVVEDDDSRRIALLKSLGFKKGEIEGIDQVRPPDKEVLGYGELVGFTIRNAEIIDEFSQYRDVQMAVFPHIKSMSKRILEIYSNASFYHPDLDIVAVSTDGVFAAFCTGRIDPVSRIAELEPVGTHPNYRKKGLAKACILECLKRLQRYRPAAILILGAAPTDGANRLYESVGFENMGERYIWTME